MKRTIDFIHISISHERQQRGGMAEVRKLIDIRGVSLLDVGLCC